MNYAFNFFIKLDICHPYDEDALQVLDINGGLPRSRVIFAVCRQNKHLIQTCLTTFENYKRMSQQN